MTQAIQNQIIALRRQISALENTELIFTVEPKNPSTQKIWLDTENRTTKYWDGSNWILSGSDLTDWNTSVVFTASDYRTIAWTSGVVSVGTSTSQTDYATTSGSFVMTTTTYFYWQADNPTAIQTATVPGDVVVAGGILIAVGRLNSDTANKASLKVFGGPSVDQIIADEIVANSITTNMLQANAVTASKIATTLLYAGAITLDTGGHIKGGQTAYNTGTGFFLGYESSAYKFSIGDATNNFMTWNGTALSVSGDTKNVVTLTAAQRISAGAPVRVTSGGVMMAGGILTGAVVSADPLAFRSNVIGVALANAASGASVDVQIGGILGVGTYSPGYTYIISELQNAISASTFDSAVNCYVGNTVGQTFPWSATNGDNTIGKIYVQFSAPVGNAGNVSISIYATSAGIPTGSALATSVTVAATACTGSIAFEFSDTWQASSASTYCFTVNVSGGDGGNYVVVRRSNTDVYASGTYLAYGGGTWTADATRDLYFGICRFLPSLAGTGITSGAVAMGVCTSTNKLMLKPYIQSP